jgi:hypothetical protein
VLRAKVSGGNQPTGFIVDQWTKVADLSRLGGKGCGATGHHFAVFHAAHDIDHVRDFFKGFSFGPNLITRSHDDIDIRMSLGKSCRGIFHVI